MTPLASLVPRLRKLRLRSTVVVPFVLELTLAVGLVSYLSFRSSQAAVDDLATQLRSEITARIDGELRRYLGEPHYFDQLNAAAFAQGNFDMQGASNANQFMTQVRMSPYEYSSYVGDAQGRYLGAYRLTYQGSKTIAMAVSNDSTNHHFYFYAMDSRGNRGQLLQQLKPYDPRKRPWYIAASKAKKPVWSDIYLDFASGLPTITASTPVYDAKGRLQGVCATDVVLLENLRSFLQSLSMGPHGQAFIVDPYGQMLTSSSNEPLTVGSGQQAKLLLAKDSQQPLVRETSRYILEEFGGFTNIRKTTQLRYSLGRDQELVQVLPLNDGRGIDWRIVVVIPEADFMGRIYQNSHDNLVLVAGALAIAMIIGVFTAQWITRPLMSLARASEEVAKGNLDQKLDLGSIAEIATVGQAFNRMSEQLKATFEVLAQKNDALAIAEENFHSIFENALEGIFQSLPDGRFISANPATARIYGYDSPAELMEQVTNINSQLFVHASDQHVFAQIMANHGQVKDFEHQAYQKDGSIIWVKIDGRSVRDESGRVTRYEGIVQDISDRIRQNEILEKMVNERTADLAEANESIAALNARLESENLRMGAELDILRRMQQLILPRQNELDEIEDLDIAGYMQAADEVGGDYYDVLLTDGVVTFGIGDVTGHGLESGILMVMTQTAVRTLNEIRESDPVRFLDTLNRTLFKNLARMGSDRHLTLALLNYHAGRVSISGQHEETLVVRANGQVERLNTIDLGFPIGLSEEIAEFVHHVTVELAPGDGIVLYTDGIPESENLAREFYGVDRLCAVVSANWHLEAEEIKRTAIEDVRSFIGEQEVYDDITLVVLKRKGTTE